MSNKNKNLKFIFILNDNENKALSLISRYRIKKGNNATILFDIAKRFNDISFKGLLTYEHYYQLSKYLFFDNCVFGDTNGINGKILVERLSKIIKQACEKKEWDIGWVFIRITDYQNKNQTIDNLLIQYESDANKETRISETGGKSYVSVSFMNFGKTIILNKCFIDSRYTMFGNNISHEAINCFKTDTKERYFYLCSSGVLKRDYFETGNYDSLPKHYLDKSKLIYFDYSKVGRNDDDNAQYVFLRKAENVELMDAAFDDSVIRNHYLDINYDGVNICDIFDKNSYSNNQSDDSLDEQLHESGDNAVKVYVTFKAASSDVFKPKFPEQAVVVPNDNLNGLKGSTMRHFVIEGSSFFNSIMRKVGQENFWKVESVPTLANYKATKAYQKDNIPDSILNIVGHDTKETFYSDVLAYAFSKSSVITNQFLQKAGVQKRVDAGFYEVKRENKNIDILIKNNRNGNKFIVVIENKISANFNADELKTWDKFVDSKSKNNEIIANLENEKHSYELTHPDKNMNCQLSKYYLLARYIAKLNNIPDDDNNVKCLITCPEPYADAYESKKDSYGYGEKYDVCSYKIIDEAIGEVINNKSDLALEEDERQTIIEIKKCLAPHINKTDVLFILRNKHRFYKSVVEIKRKRRASSKQKIN